MSKITKLVIDRKRWIPGFMESGNHTHCALGFYFHEMGVPTEILKGTGSPDHLLLSGQEGRLARYTQDELAMLLAKHGAEWLMCPVLDRDNKVVGLASSREATAVVNVNDQRHNTAEGEQCLKAIFGRHGVELTFE